MLVDHADAQLDGIVGLCDIYRLAAELDFPFVLRVETVDHVHKGAFARAVFTQKGKDLPLLEGKADRIIG